MTVPPERPQDPLQQAAELQRAGQAARAQGICEDILRATPERLDARSLLAVCLLEQGAIDAGLAQLRQILGKAPEHGPTHFNLANALNAKGDSEGALTHYRAAVRLAPTLLSAWHNLGNVLTKLGEAEGAAAAYEKALALRHGPARPQASARLTVGSSKLRHDAELFAHLANLGQQPERFAALSRLYAQADAAKQLLPDRPGLFVLPLDLDRALRPSFDRLLHWPQPARLSQGAINPNLDSATLEAAYAQSGAGILAVDDLLRPEALEALRRFCAEATVWFGGTYPKGYVGAFMDRGFNCPLLRQIGEELAASLPAIFAGHRLRKFWAFKCDARLAGIPLHADFAAVNVNFWITPDSANLDPKGGGLVVWDKETPLEWDFETYNKDEDALADFLTQSGASAVRIPYRQNRAVVFNSNLVHKTDDLNFREGYMNRRINITLLYGTRDSAQG